MTSVYLVRHAKTLDRYSWAEPDELRPLSKAGFRQAEALHEHLGGIEFERLVSSPLIRCVQTFEPLAEATSTPIELADELAEGAPGRPALDLLRELAGNGPVAACTHGDVLLDALAELRSTLVPLEGPWECKKGSTWVLDVDDRTIVGGRYLPPPAVEKERSRS
jgi:8-oxo-dGTP diphosphatase